ncbi:hypothetical protein ACQPZ2_23325 [Nocardia pseudovaccinii]|uniref:hypothetical protein n=1 Tax=Nocardia pseudovaccinii TaxID=189540 RepID=UPI003D936455
MDFPRRRLLGTTIPALLVVGGLIAATTACSDGDSGSPGRASGAAGPGMSLLTPQQHQVDEIALKLLEDPAVKAARDDGKKILAALPQAQLEAGKATLDGAVDEAEYLAVRSVAARVPSTPTIIWTSGPGYSWGNQQVPGSRWAGDGPDRIYRSFAAAPQGSYVIHGRRAANPSNDDFSFEARSTATIGPNPSATLTGHDIDIASDGTFTVTVDAQPTAPGQRNHLTLAAGSQTVVMRDTLTDWSTQTPNQLTVTRTDSNPTTTTPPPADLANQAAAEVVRIIEQDAGFIAAANAQPVNSARTNIRQARDGVPGTAGSWAPFHLGPDQALVFTIHPHTASYVSIQLTDPWFRSIPYWNHTSSLTNQQIKPNSDGSVTYVVSLEDPGYYNWLDPDGLTDGIYLLRVEDFATPPADPGAIVDAPELIDRAALPSVLDPGMPRVDAAGRAEQLDQRAVGYQRRLAQ